MGITALHYYLSNLRDRHFLFGPDGLIGPKELETFPRGGLTHLSLFSHWSSPWIFEILYFGAIAAAIVFVLFGGRISTMVHTLFYVSAISRNIFIGDGGDNLVQVILPFLALTTNNAYFSLRADRIRTKLKSGVTINRNLIHNSAAAMIVFQVLLVYIVASYWKLTGAVWQNGTAMYFILNNDEFRFLHMPAWMLNNAFIVTSFSYAIIGIQLAVAPAVLTRKYTEVAVGLVMAMHLGIALFMGLVGFGFNMMAADTVLLSDHRYRRLTARLRSLKSESSRDVSIDSHQFETLVDPVRVGNMRTAMNGPKKVPEGNDYTSSTQGSASTRADSSGTQQ